MAFDETCVCKSANARVVPRPTSRFRTTVREKPRNVARFGVGDAIALLRLELRRMRRLDTYDIEWYEGEVLGWLYDRLCAMDIFAGGPAEHLEWLANTDQTESIDLAAVTMIGKRRYYRILFAVLKELYREEGVPGDITGFVLRCYGFVRAWSAA